LGRMRSGSGVLRSWLIPIRRLRLRLGWSELVF
jgi:hypothetical protein